MRLIGVLAAIMVIAIPVAAWAASGDIGWVDRFTVWVINEQRAFHRELTGYLRDLAAAGGDWRLVWPLIAASFLYGLFHAAGPGHGKAVVSSYLLSHKQTIRIGMWLAAGAAFMQGLVAVVIVYGLVALAGWVPRDAQGAVLWSERASFALVALLGGYLLLRAARSLKNRMSGGHGHHHHDHTHDHGCGHAHMPTANDAAQVRDLKSALGVIVSVGIRPCSGAVIVLVFARVAGLSWAGIAAVLAMSAGTALAVSMLAAFAVTARNVVSRLSWMEGSKAGWAADLAALAGGLLILFVGLTLLSAAFRPAHPIIGA
ncbi:MAG: nickel/cobalt transporter [Rhodospirillales bacterium]|nr:nickel/cobalt transporter [Rhodospirillales bacterium]